MHIQKADYRTSAVFGSSKVRTESKRTKLTRRRADVRQCRSPPHCLPSPPGAVLRRFHLSPPPAPAFQQGSVIQGFPHRLCRALGGTSTKTSACHQDPQGGIRPRGRRGLREAALGAPAPARLPLPAGHRAPLTGGPPGSWD